MTYLIADSGATKAEWRLTSENVSKTIFTEGLNPYYHTTESIKNVLHKHLLPKLGGHVIDKIFFYGAGCDEPDRNAVVRKVLAQLFSNAAIEIEHDLLAAARACFGDEAGIACILGTGSNSCLYDGQKIIEHMPSLAFILGDEGSAGYFGKQIINRYFRKELPQELEESLEESHNMSLKYIMHGLYDGDQKSRFIASYGAFLGQHADHPYIKKMLRAGFYSFITRIIKKYSNATSYEVRFVGSVAQAHRQMITNILNKEGLQSGLFIQKPLERLVEYHTA